MIVIVQRVQSAAVAVDGEICGSCEKGLLLLCGVAKGDTEQDARLIADKIVRMRIFEDENQKMNLSVADVGGSVLAISNFTLCADYRKGNRPDYFGAADPISAKALYAYFCDLLSEQIPTQRGVFGADMKIDVLCDGPVTISVDSRVLRRSREP